jgi:hypothetical protein
MVVGDTTIKEAAAVPPKLTAEAAVKLVPVSVTVSPEAAVIGANEVIVGAGIKVNPPRDALPPGVVTETLPELPAATTAVIVVAFTTENEVAAVPPKLTAEALVKLVPVTVTVSPVAAEVGVKDAIVGAGMKINPASDALPPGVVTATLPELPAATTAVMVVAFTTENEAAAVPPKLTAVVPVKLVPVTVTVAPEAAEVGVKDAIVGAGMKVNPASEALPPGVVTATLPELPAATTAVIVVAFTTKNEAAAVPPKLTAEAAVKLVPVNVTVAPVAAEVGVKEAIVGAGIKVNPASDALPPGVVTAILPELPAATTAVIEVGETTLNDAAAVPPKLTAVVPVKLVPVTVTVAPEAAEVGVKEAIVGAGMNVNPASEALPPGVVTDMLPELPAATTALIVVAFTTENEVAAVPPKETAEAPVKLVPVTVTVSPEAAEVGVKEAIVGAGIKINPASVALPPGVVTAILPELPAATTAVMVVAFTTLKEAAAVPPKLTAEAAVKLVPVMVTVAPDAAEVGVKDAIVGAGINTNPASVALPPGVVTETLPELPAATTAVIVVAFTTENEVAAVPPKLTAVVPVKLVPVTVTVSPVAAEVGVNEVIVGAGINVNPASDAIPPGVVTATLPELPAATTAVMVVAFTTLKEEAAVPPKLTAEASVKLVPVMVTVAPVAAVIGANEVIVGAGMKVNPASEALPPGVVTAILPELPAATTAVIEVGETTKKEAAAVPPKLTAEASVKLVPVMVTVSPEAAVIGANEVIVGAGIKVNPASDTLPPGVVTDTLPELPAAKTAVIEVGETTKNEAAAVPPKLTAEAAVKLVPVMVTVSPEAAVIGANEAIVGAGMNVNPASDALPPGVVTAILPELPAATTAVTVVAFTTLKEEAAVPPKLTVEALVKLVPVIVTVAPDAAEVGVNEVIVGAGINVNPASEALPPRVVT